MRNNYLNLLFVSTSFTAIATWHNHAYNWCTGDVDWRCSWTPASAITPSDSAVLLWHLYYNWLIAHTHSMMVLSGSHHQGPYTHVYLNTRRPQSSLWLSISSAGLSVEQRAQPLPSTHYPPFNNLLSSTSPNSSTVMLHEAWLHEWHQQPTRPSKHQSQKLPKSPGGEFQVSTSLFRLFKLPMDPSI